jgi:uncharacterized protein (TIGR01777 family)
MGRSHSFHWKSILPNPITEVFVWHTRPGAFERLNAPWRPVRVIRSSAGLAVGSQVEIRIPIFGGIGIPWQLTHTAYDPPQMFRDEQIRGPFRQWSHTHSFIGESETTTTMHDAIEYQLPYGASVLNWALQRELRRLFTFRHSILTADLELHSRWRHKPRKTILIAGASGFIGHALRAFLSTGGHSVLTLVRRAPRSTGELFWDPSNSILDPQVFNGVDAVINLCGENIAAGRWNHHRKTQIEESRVRATALLARTIATLPVPPEVCINASGCGFYGDTGETEVDESAPAGSDFLARVCTAWEAASSPLEPSSCRNVHLRLGIVLNASGGALSKMLPAFCCGVGGRLGSGQQFVSWIGLQDLLGIFEHTLYTEELSGPVNCVSPHPCTNREFTATLAHVVRRPALLPAPALALRLVLGEMSQMLLSSSRVRPQRLLDSGYRFIHPELRTALQFECGK